MSEKFKILSIDGGGFRGTYSAHLLHRIEDEFSVDWRNDFNLIAGTSTGAIIAACLALGIPAKKVVELYENHGRDIFQKSGFPKLGLFGCKYDNKGLREPGGKNENRKEVFFVEASKEFRNGKAQNFLEPEYLEKILAAVEKREEIEKFCRPVLPEEIAENDYNLNITRYVDTVEEEEEVDIEANLAALKEIDAELKKVEAEMQQHLEELGIGED